MMVRFAADENFNGIIVRGIRRHDPDIDILTAQEASMDGSDDPAILEWAAKLGRVLLTHDVTTMTAFAYDRVAAGLNMPGVLQVASHFQLSAVIDDLILVARCSLDDEWEGLVRHLPLK